MQFFYSNFLHFERNTEACEMHYVQLLLRKMQATSHMRGV